MYQFGIIHCDLKTRDILIDIPIGTIDDLKKVTLKLANVSFLTVSALPTHMTPKVMKNYICRKSDVTFFKILDDFTSILIYLKRIYLVIWGVKFWRFALGGSSQKDVVSRPRRTTNLVQGWLQTRNAIHQGWLQPGFGNYYENVLGLWVWQAAGFRSDSWLFVKNQRPNRKMQKNLIIIFDEYLLKFNIH